MKMKINFTGMHSTFLFSLSFFKGKFLSTQDYYFINDEIFIGWINFGGEGSKKVLAFTRNSIEICIG